ncbi:MAG: alpha/beta hydrolase [Bryobacteraceae bacterium]
MNDTRLDPEVRVLLELIEAQCAPPLESLPPQQARQAAAEGLKDLAGPAEPVARVEDVSGPVRMRVYAPESGGPMPALVYFHGGGWVVCDLETHDNVCRAIARQAGAVVVAVDYRLAPEHKFPAAVEDCQAATLWVGENAARLGVDPRRIAVGGDSAGGNLATVVALKCRDEGGPALAAQILVYPVTNLASFDTASYGEFAEGYNLTRSEMEWFRDCYLARLEDAAHPHASPLLEPNLRGLPPALVITAECDVLRDEGEAYAKRLEEFGVPVICTRYPGMIHPFFSMPGRLMQARRAIGQVAAAVRNPDSLK